MAALIIGLIFIAFSVFAVLPAGLGWLEAVIAVIKGGLPLAVLLVGLVSFSAGLASVKDRAAKNDRQKKTEIKE